MADVWPWDGVVLPYVIDFSDARWVGVNGSFSIPDYGIITPRRFEKFVNDLDVFFRDGVAIIVLYMLCQLSLENSGRCNFDWREY